MLSNIRVLDFSRLLPGPYASQMLADLGAEVIKVEEPGLGDYARMGTPSCVDGLGITFHSLNRGKKSVSLNIKNTSDCKKLLKLISTADVLIESFRPGVLTKYLLKHFPNQTSMTGPHGSNSCSTPPTSYLNQLKTLLAAYPRLIICCISGYGQTGPLLNRAGHDINYISKAGLLNLMKEPTLPPMQIADIAGGTWPAVSQILGSLYQRERTGLGNIIDVSMTDVSYAMAVMPQGISNLNISKNGLNINNFENGKNNIISRGEYVLVGKNPCYQVYKCKDGYISCGALEPKFWKMFCKDVLNREDLINKQFVTGNEGDKVKKEIERILMLKNRKEWDKILKNVDCCVETVPESEGISERNEQLKSRELDVTISIEGKKGKKDVVKLPKSPFNMLHGTKFQTKQAPGLGEHNKEILSKL